VDQPRGEALCSVDEKLSLPSLQGVS
jgi:hypothetical protein